MKKYGEDKLNMWVGKSVEVIRGYYEGLRGVVQDTWGGIFRYTSRWHFYEETI